MTHRREKHRRPKGRIQPDYIAVGRILAPHGIRGEVKVEILTDYPERFFQHPTLYVGPAAVPVKVKSARYFKSYVLLSFENRPDRNAVEELRGLYLQIPISEAMPLEEGEFYLFQAIGLEVVTDEGDLLGTVTEVIETGANAVFVVKGEGREILIPDTKEVVLGADLEKGTLTVHLIPGLVPEQNEES
jgi:16S rRNA processing protein RimM